MKPRVFSGIQPSGILHIGNLYGAIRAWVEMQDDFESIFSIVDLHAITVDYEVKNLAAQSLEAANVYLAAGLDPAKSAIFIQSQIASHAELTWLLNCVASMGELSRMTQFKDKAGSR